MNRFNKIFLLPVGVLTCLLVGCCHDCSGQGSGKSRLFSGMRRSGYWPCVDKCSTIAPGTLPAPNGSYMSAWQLQHKIKADADDFVIYQNEWVDNTTVLGPFGQKHIEKIVQGLPQAKFPVVIEPNWEDPSVNPPRLNKIIQLLAMRGVPDAPQRVVMGWSQAEGLYGDEAERIYFNMHRNQIRQFGYGFGGFGGIGGLGGFGLPGFGGFGGFGGGMGGLGGFGGFGGMGGFFR